MLSNQMIRLYSQMRELAAPALPGTNVVGPSHHQNKILAKRNLTNL